MGGATWQACVMHRRFSALLLVPLLLALAGAPAAAQTSDVVRFDLVPEQGTEFRFGERTYGGSISVSWHRDGLAVVESVPLDGYLAGIREVPLSWPEETLKAQAVAARTYLAWTLTRGRSRDGARYDFDICATTQCQVYAGTGVVRTDDGPRWLSAIDDTTGEILVFGGEPAQTLYSSSAGSRTRANQDIWGGDAKPYLQPVDSPESGVTPYERWELDVEVEAMRRVFALAGTPIGSTVTAVYTESPGEGNGPTRLVVESNTGRVEIDATQVRSRFNRFGPVLYPGLFPATAPNGNRWPQAFLSYTFDVEFEPGAVRPLSPLLPSEDLPSAGTVRFIGEGWGHGIGMSQWGAKALGDQGTGYAEILGHYYAGLTPVDGGGAVPEVVAVGLAWGRDDVGITASGPFELRANGVPVARYDGGTWSFRVAQGGIDAIPPWQSTLLSNLRPWPR